MILIFIPDQVVRLTNENGLNVMLSFSPPLLPPLLSFSGL